MLCLNSCRSYSMYSKNNNNILSSCQRVINIIRNTSSTTPPPPPSSSSSSISQSNSKPLRFFDHPSGKHKTPKKR